MGSMDYDYLKQTISNSYYDYCTNIENKLSLLKDLTSLFRINIDDDNLDNCYIKEIDLDNLTLVIVDKEKDIIYSAAYMFKNKSLNNSSLFIETTIQNKVNKNKYQRIYHIDYNEPIVEKMIYTASDGDIIFEKEIPSCNLFGNDEQVIVRSVKQKGKIDGNIRQSWVTKFTRNTERTSNRFVLTSKKYSFLKNDYLGNLSTCDKLYNLVDGNIIYSVNEFNKKNHCNYFRGACFESVTEECDRFLPVGITSKKFDILHDDNVISAIIFEGGIDKNQQLLEIYKFSDYIEMRYMTRNFLDREGESLKYSTFVLPVDDSGTIKNDQIDLMKEKLDTILKNDSFSSKVREELSVFGQKISTKNNKTFKNQDNILNMKFLFNYNLGEILNLVNIDEVLYFSSNNENSLGLKNSINKVKTKKKIVNI